MFGCRVGFSGSADQMAVFPVWPNPRGRPCWKIQMVLSPRWIIRFTPCFVLGWDFRCWRIEWCYFELGQIQYVCGSKQCGRSN